MEIWGYITAVDIQIDKCRETDPGNADAYDLAYALYGQETAPLLMRIDLLLNAEISRAGAPKDAIKDRQQPIIEMLNRQVQRSFTTNRNLWLQACRELPDAAKQRKFEFTPLHEKFPEDMRLIDGWR